MFPKLEVRLSKNTLKLMKNTCNMFIEFLLFPILRISGRLANDWSSYPISTEKYLVLFILLQVLV